MSRYFSSILRTHFPRHVSQTKNTIETKNHNKHLMNYSCKFIYFLFRSITCEIFFPKLCCEVQLYIQKNYLKNSKVRRARTFKKYPHFPNPTSNAAHRLGRFLQRWTGLGCTWGKGRRWGSGLADRLKMLDEKEIMIFLIQINVKRSFVYTCCTV